MSPLIASMAFSVCLLSSNPKFPGDLPALGRFLRNLGVSSKFHLSSNFVAIGIVLFFFFLMRFGSEKGVFLEIRVNVSIFSPV